VLFKFNSKFPVCHLLMAIPSYGASKFRNFKYSFDDIIFWGVGLCFFRYFWQSISCLGFNDL
jgi:hypothetical protein